MINAEPIISKMKNQKINYDKVLKKLIGQWEREAIRPKIYCIVVVHLVVHIH
ncbi:adenine nucleotide alpha hydrolases superfamily protein [Staphylococcus aureus]|uniref:Adenine nucleotide alpha hydrolases superfamily protein n=1 Tax=Staphylococcus aureus TaxID=1280 RepID=A0A380DXE8_STAAU|nr:adenine nucleotide alpha hydrolases superfamily protein [Staphylococcus aureus]